MRRPGNLDGLGYTPRHLHTNIGGLGNFGKGFYMPPPSAPPPVSGKPAKYFDGKWQCEGNPPPNTATGYYHCCPVGWSLTNFEVTKPCGKDYGQTVCGPLPKEAKADEAVCCENLREWMPATPGSDPCRAAALASGKAVPSVTETMLAPDLVVEQGPLISPVVAIGGGLAVAALFIITIIFKLKS